jgi:hypothetical protein
MTSVNAFPFLSLPLELRESIYSLYFKPADRLLRNYSLETQGYFGGVYRFDFNLYKVNKQVYKEAKAVWKRENVFVKIATPWPSAGMYRVYLMATDGRDLMDYEAGGTGEWSVFTWGLGKWALIFEPCIHVRLCLWRWNELCILTNPSS